MKVRKKLKYKKYKLSGSIKERLTSLAKDDKLSAYWDATSIFLKFCLLLVVLKK